MQREIKFRAWDKNNKKMIFPGDIVGEDELMISSSGKITRISNNNACGDDDCCGANEDYIVDCSYYGYVLLQYTGFKDKDGKEIYEGDIVKDIFLGGVVEIKYEHHSYIGQYGEYRTVFGYNFGQDYEDKGKFLNLEVIGNIYENEDFLNN